MTASRNLASLPPLDLEEVKRAIREKHSLRLSDSDPILAVATLMDLMAERTAQRYVATLTPLLAKQIDDSKLIAEQIINTAATHIAEHSLANLKEAIEQSVTKIRAETTAQNDSAKQLATAQETLTQQANKSAKWAWWGAFASLLTGGIFVGLIIGTHL
ncbi:hypothetical protein AA105894_1685 [Asaia spathodeae NBRC 105894]|nr:hypothetical protein AA105894_1685 [Asaia spathodeae NBRC 105894]